MIDSVGDCTYIYYLLIIELAIVILYNQVKSISIFSIYSVFYL